MLAQLVPVASTMCVGADDHVSTVGPGRQYYVCLSR